jgi:hypothetical protein
LLTTSERIATVVTPLKPGGPPASLYAAAKTPQLRVRLKHFDPTASRGQPVTLRGWMNRSLYVTAFGTKIVPRVPFVLSFRPPRLLLEHGGKAVVFGVAGDGQLGFSPVRDAKVDDVTLDVTEFPPVPVFALYTENCGTRAAGRSSRTPASAALKLGGKLNTPAASTRTGDCCAPHDRAAARHPTVSAGRGM